MIREFRDNDSDACCRMAVEDWNAVLRGGYPPDVADQFIARYTPGQFSATNRVDRIYLVEDDSEILAFASMRERQEGAEIKRFFVKQHSIGRGVGAELMGFLFDWYSGMRLTVKSTKNAVGFYQKHGFEITSEAENGYWLEAET
jgi:GNAT superfamily N-acetyltransferase